MSHPSPTKQKIDELRNSMPVGDEHCEPTREMLRVASFACNGAPDKQQAVADALGSIAYFLALVHRSEPERIGKAVADGILKHESSCALKTGNPTLHASRAEKSAETLKVALTGALVANMKTAIIMTVGGAVIIAAMIIFHGDFKTAVDAIPKHAAGAVPVPTHEIGG